MRCASPATSVSAHRRQSARLPPPRRQDAARARALLRRMSTGRWPTWSILGIIPPDRDPVLIVGVEWLRTSDDRFAVLCIGLDGRSVKWTPCATSTEVIALLKERVQHVVGTMREVA